MTSKNPNYDFKWCPGCGDFGVRRALEFALNSRNEQLETRMKDTVVVAGIGCSGNLVHLMEGTDQPFGIHGTHGRTLPMAFGVKMANPVLNVVVVAGDGDFLSIGAEHIGPQAQRNLNVSAIVMDNGVYGLTKGQKSPTSELGVKTSSTPYGNIEGPVNPLSLYIELGVSFVASHYSSKPRELAKLFEEAMQHDGFAIVHVQSPCTTYNDNYQQLKGNPRQGIEPGVIELPDTYDPTNKTLAMQMADGPKIPLGVLYREERQAFDKSFRQMASQAPAPTPDKILATYAI